MSLVSCISSRRTIKNLNPQTVFNKSLIGTKLDGINFENKNFEDVYITGANFTGATNVIINPHKVRNLDLSGCNLSGVKILSAEIDGDFIGVNLNGAKLDEAEIILDDYGKCRQYVLSLFN